MGFWRLRPLGSFWDPHGLWDGTAQRISIAARKGRLGSCPELHSQQPGHWAIPAPVLWTETPLPPPPSPHGVQSVGLGIGLPLSVILICKTTGGDAARILNVTCGLTTLVMHDPHPEFPKSETFSVPAEPVPGGMGEGRARIWAEVEAGLLQGLQTPRVSHSVSPLWTRPRDVGAVTGVTTWTNSDLTQTLH